jgi:starch-binding outer membrane protein, SusD/RagB family
MTDKTIPTEYPSIEIIKDLSTGASTYIPVQLLVKNPYQDKMNVLPIETSEIRRNPDLVQTTGW